jgi:hypothetical protein
MQRLQIIRQLLKGAARGLSAASTTPLATEHSLLSASRGASWTAAQTVVQPSSSSSRWSPAAWGVSGSSRGFASEADAASGYGEDYDYISYPPARAFVGQMAPDFEAPGAFVACVELRTGCRPCL